MDSPTLPDAHQQIRLGDIQASAQKWMAAIEYYSSAIEYFKAIQSTLRDPSLIPIIQAQIVQCEKTINLCRVKDRSDQAMKAAQHSKIPRTYSESNIKPSIPRGRMTRASTVYLQNTMDLDGRNGMDSFAAAIFPNHRKASSRIPSSVAAKKTKNDSQKMEELQMSNEALKNHLKEAFDNIERLKRENNVLRVKRTSDASQYQPVVFGLIENTNEDDNESEDEREATI